MLGNARCYRRGRAHTTQAWLIKEDFQKEMTYILNAKGKAGTFWVNRGPAAYQAEGKEYVKVLGDTRVD